MAKLGISTGSSPNDGTGDSLIDGAVKANLNFNEIYTAIGDGTTLAVPVTSVAAGTGINLSGSTGSVTITNTGIANTNNLRTDFLEVSGISTLSGGLTVTGNATATQFVGGGAGVTGISTLNITNYGIGLGGGGSSYTNSDVDSHLNQGTASSGEVLSWTGSDYDWVAQSGGGGITTADVRTNSLVVSGITTLTGNLSIGAGTSTGVTNTPSLTLSNNNPTVVSTSGTTGQFKQIGGQPYYYDGTTWRALFLSEAPLTVNQADSDWDNTMIRMNFDQATIGDVTNLKDGRTPTTSNIDLVAAPVKYGTKSARYQTNNLGINFTQDNSGSQYYPFEGTWTLEGWFYFNSSKLPTVTSIINSPILFANFHPSTNTNNNWKIGYYHIGGSSSSYDFYWANSSSSNTAGGQAGNSGTGFNLQRISSTTFANNAWHHIAIVRETNGSIHFYFDGDDSGNTVANQLVDLEINDYSNQSFNIGYYGTSGDAGRFEGNIDDIRVSKSARYTSNFTPPASSLPITGSTTTIITPPDSKVGEISLGGSPAWTGTPGVTASQVAAGQYRATFATAYSSATDYVIQTSMNDYTPATTPVGIGVSRFTTHADFFVRRVSDGANIDTGSLAIDLFKK